jgi:hypothetical protein
METVLKNVYNLTSLTKYLNNKFGNKKTGKLFNTTDVQFYVIRGKLPKYLGGNKIEKVAGELKLYKLI